MKRGELIRRYLFFLLGLFINTPADRKSVWQSVPAGGQTLSLISKLK